MLLYCFTLAVIITILSMFLRVLPTHSYNTSNQINISRSKVKTEKSIRTKKESNFVKVTCKQQKAHAIKRDKDELSTSSGDEYTMEVLEVPMPIE